MNNYDDIVKQIRADAARIAGDHNSKWAQAAPPAPTGPSFDEYAKGLNYEALDFEGKQNAQKAWLNQYGAGWKAAGADPEKDLQQYAQIPVPKSGGLTNTDWYDLAAQTVNRSFGAMSNVIGNAVGPGSLQDRFNKQGAEYMAAAKANEANFSEATADALKKNARLQAEAAKQYGGENNVPFTTELALAAGEIGRNPLNFAAQTAGNAVIQAPGYALQAAGAALSTTGAGATAGVPLVLAGRAYGAASGAAQTAGEVGQAASDEVMRLKPSQLEKLPTYQEAYNKAIGKGINERDASLAAQRAVASEVMNYGATLGAGVGAAGGLVSGISGAGKLAENIGKKAVTEFFKRSGVEFVTEGVEGYATKVAENVASRSGGSDTSLTRGAAGSALQEAAGGLTQAGGAAAIGKTVSMVSDAIKGGSTVERAPAKATLAERMADMPEYVRDFANDLVDTVIATPNPTAAQAVDIQEAKDQLVQFGFTQQDLDSLYAAEVKADAPVVPKDVMAGTYKPSETGGAPNTEAPTRLMTELAAAGPLTLEGVNQVAVDHEKGYSEWVEATQSQPSRVPSQQFISGTADNMVLTALANNVPMTPELKAYADNLAATKNQASIDTDRNNMGSRLMADGKSLMTESDYQASQMGRGKDLVGKYVLYGNAEGYVVQRPEGLYVVDNRPGNTQDIFIEGGESEETPAQLGLKLMTPPKVSVPQQRQGAGVTPAGLVAEAQLNYGQILLNDALDMLVVSMPAAEAEMLLTQFDKFLETGTPAQLAQVIENEINKYFNSASQQDTQANDSTAQQPPAVAGSDATGTQPAGSAPSATTTFGETAQRTEAVRSRLKTWVTSLDPSLKGKTLDKMLPDVTVHDQLPMWAIKGLREQVYTEGVPMQDRTGEPTDDISKALVGGLRRPPLTVDNVVTRIGRTHIFANNMADYQDPVGILLHETWHKYQNRENVDQLRKSVEAWEKMPVGSNEYKAWAAGNEAATRDNGSGGPQEFVPHALQELWELGVRPADKTRAGTWMQRALDHVRAMINRFLGRAPKLTPEQLMDIAVKLVQTDATGRARESKQFLSGKEQTHSVEPQLDFSVADISKLTDTGRSLKEFSQQFAGDIKQKDKTLADANLVALTYMDKVRSSPSSVLPQVSGSTLSYQQYLKMPDGLTYDPNNINHITATDLTKSIYAAVKSGRIESAMIAEAQATNKSREDDLKGLVKYLMRNQDYVSTEAAVIVKAASKWGMRLTTNNDKSEVQLVEITNKNAVAIAVLNGLDASALAEHMKQGKPLKVAFKDALQQTVDAREKAAQASGKEGWVVYKKSDNHDDHVALRDGCAGREWCTAGAVSTAASQLRRGDFHIFYKKGEPIVALRTVNGRLDEAPRGSLAGQALTPYERDVAERRLRGQPEPAAVVPKKTAPAAPAQPTITGGEAFLSDQKVLADIQSGAIKDYSDVDLFTLPDYKIKAGDYETNTLSKPALKAIEAAIKERRSTAAWEQMGYYHGIDMLSAQELGAVKVVRGVVVLSDSETINFENLEYTSALEIAEGGNYNFPKLEKVGALVLNVDSTAVVNLPTLTETTGTTYLSAEGATVSAPNLKYIASQIDGGMEGVPQIGVYLPSLENVGNPAVDGTSVELLNGANLPKFKPSAYVMVSGTKVYAPLLDPTSVNFDFLYDNGYDGPEPSLKENFAVAPVPTEQPLITGGEDFLDDQKVLADIQSGAISKYADRDLWMLQGYTMKAGDYSGDALPDTAKRQVTDTIADRYTDASWKERGFYYGATETNGAIVDYPADMRGVKYVSGTVNIMKGEHPENVVAADLIEAGSVWVGFHGNEIAKARFPKLVKVHGNAGGHGLVQMDFPELKEVAGAWTFVYGGNRSESFSVTAPKLESLGGAEDPDKLTEISTFMPSLKRLTYAHLYPGANLPQLVEGKVAPQGSMNGINIPKLPEENIDQEWMDEDEDEDVDFDELAEKEDDDLANDGWRPDYSIADYNPLKRKESKNLADRLKVIEQGKIDSDIPTWQFIKDWTARKLVDVTRPFDVWARSFGNKAERAALVQSKSIAATRTSSLLSTVDMKYTEPLAKALKSIVSKNHAADVLSAKELVGTWMTVRYAPIQNAEFIKRDAEAVDAAEKAFVEAGGNMVGLRAELQATTTTRPSQNKLTMRSDAAARRFAKASDKTREAARNLAKALTEQEERLNAINSADDNLDPNVDKQGAGLAGGYNNATAARVQKLIEKRIPLAMLEAASKPVYDMLAYKSKLDLTNGKVALSANTSWLKHPHYVPLTGDPRSDDSTSDVFGTGSVNQGKDKKAEGRTSSLAQNGIDAAFEQMGKSAQYHGWLPFKQTLTAAYERMLREEGTDAKVYEKYGIKRHRENPMSNISESIVVRMGADVTRNGGGWVYTLNSQAAIDGLKGATKEEAPGWLKPVGMATMVIGRFITAYTGGFAVINALRDGPERFTNLATRKIDNYPQLSMNAVAAKAAAYWSNPATLTATRQVVAERYKSFDRLEGAGKLLPANKKDVEMLREMLDAGASSTTGAYLSRDTSELADKLVKINRGTAKMHNALVIWNDSFELKAPFAMYKALRTSGVDKNTAAAVTLDTMNFGKAGEAMAPIKALYMFSQPTMTGAHQLAMTLGTTKGKAIAIAVATLGMGLYSLVAAGGGEDPITKRKRIDALSPEMLSRNIPIFGADGDVYKVPVPFGLYQLAWASVINANRYVDGVYTGWETLGEFAKLGTKTFSPVAPSDSGISKDAPAWFIQTVTPTALKPVANIATNTGAFGQTLTNEASYKPGTAKWKTARKTTPEAYTEASKYMLDTFGLNIFPETLQESTKLFSYGLVKDLIVDPLITNPDKDAKGIARVNPLFSRWMALQTEKSIIDSAYYDIKEDITDMRLRKDGAPRGQSPLTPKEVQFDLALKQSETQESGVRKQWNELRKLENEKRISPEAYKERFQQLSRQELEIHKRFIMRYNELNK